MKIYLASPSIYQQFLRAVRDTLHEEGHTVTSRWLDVKGLGRMDPTMARMDLEDIDEAKVFMLFPLRRGDTNPSGGHLWETGYAYHARKHIILMGEPTSLFLTLPTIQRCYSLSEAVRHMETLS